MSSTRRTYTREFKIEAARLSYNSDKPVEEIARDLGVGQSSLTRCGGGNIELILTRPFPATAR